MKIIFIFIFVVASIICAKSNNNFRLGYSFPTKLVNEIPIETLVKVEVTPSYNYCFDIMKIGIRQHIDRNYTYDVIPKELLGGIFFQGIHRVPTDTSIAIKVLVPMKLYFFFHNTVNGGYSKIFSNLKDWNLCDTAPQYDINNGDHGLKMIMYSRIVKAGTYYIPATIKDRACFNIVFKPL